MPPSISSVSLPIVVVVLHLASLSPFTVMFTNHFRSQPFFLSLSCSFSLVRPWSLCLLASSSVAWPSRIVRTCHWPTGAVGDEVYCCGLEAGSSSCVRGGRGSNYGTALPLIAAVDSNLCKNLKEASQDCGGPRQAVISWTFLRIVLLI